MGNSSATLTREPETETEQEQAEKVMLTTLQTKFGIELMREGFTAVPNRIRKRYRMIGMTPTEYVLWETIISFQHHEELPWPSEERLADMMIKSSRTIRRYIKRLEEKGFLIVERGEKNQHGTTTNRYDFSPLYEQILTLEAKITSPKTPKDTHLSSPKMGTDNVSSPSSTYANMGKDNVSSPSQNGKTPKMPTELSAEMASKEERIQEDLPQERFESSKALKGTVFGSQPPADGYTNPNSGGKSNGSYEGTKGTNGSKQRNENENENPRREKGSAAAPPAWLNGASRQSTDIVKPLPRFLAQVVEDISAQYHDQAAKSSQTIAAKLYEEVAKRGGEERNFADMITYARADTSAADIRKRNKDGSINRMPYFFKILAETVAKNIKAWDEEDAARSRGGEAAPKQ